MANTSQRLLRAGLACSRRSGTRIYYSLASQAVERLWRALRETAEAHSGELGDLVRAYVGDRADLNMITRDELLVRLRQGDVVVLGVRPQPEYEADISRVRFPCPSRTLSPDCARFPRGAKSSPTAADHTAYMRTRPCGCSRTKGATPQGLRMASPSGRRQGSR